jgi:chromosome segregation ATPase
MVDDLTQRIEVSERQTAEAIGDCEQLRRQLSKAEKNEASQAEILRIRTQDILTLQAEVEELKQQATMEHSISEILLKEVNNKLDENEVQFERAREPQGLKQREIYEEMAASVETEMTLTDRIRAKQGAVVQ